MIPKTYHYGNTEDRAYARDFWSWLKDQPQDAWLLWARTANWDNADFIFERMVEDPGCDRAIVSWLFWMSEPGYFVENPDAFEGPSLTRQILANLERGFYRRAELAYDRYEVVHSVHAFLAALAKAGRAAPFAVPRALCGPFDGRPARIVDAYDPQTESDLAELLACLGGGLRRSEAQHRDEETRGGNFWIKPRLRLPDVPADPAAFSQLGDIAYLEAIFGTRAAYAAARSAGAAASSPQTVPPPSRLGRGERLTLQLLGLFALVSIGGALVPHWLRTGTW